MLASHKKHLCKNLNQDDAIIKKLIYERWEIVLQEFINDKVESMTEKLQTIKDIEDKISSY